VKQAGVINISGIKPDLLQKIDSAPSRQYLDRSSWFRVAAVEKLKRENRQKEKV
jgi:metal-responsive CopG/Arc/MetJ family transcriptional regulator